jgi:tetratricopeptide (TPR) repeat protein
MWLFAAAFLLLFQTPDYSADGIKALEEGKYDAAVQAFTKAIEADPKDYFAHFNLAFAYGALHKDAEAIAEYRKTLELKPGLYEAELNGGIVMMRQKQPADALPLLAHAAEQKPAEFRPRYYLAEAQYQTGAYAEAEANYRLALEVDAKSAAAEFGLAHALARQSKLDDAAPHYRKAAELDARYRDDLLELAELYEKNHQMADAVAIYREFPANTAAQEHLGQLMLESKQYTDAIPRLEAAYQQSPTEANRVALAAAYLFAGQIDKALPLLDKAVAEEPRNYDVRMMYARALRDRKQYPAAATQFLEAAKLKPAEAKTWGELGGMLYMMAESAYAAAQGPDKTAGLQRAAGMYQQSLAAFDKARELGEDIPGNWFLRAIILDKLRQPKPALEAYQKFLGMSQGKNPDQEFQARQRVRILQREVEKR